MMTCDDTKNLLFCSVGFWSGPLPIKAAKHPTIEMLIAPINFSLSFWLQFVQLWICLAMQQNHQAESRGRVTKNAAPHAEPRDASLLLISFCDIRNPNCRKKCHIILHIIEKKKSFRSNFSNFVNICYLNSKANHREEVYILFINQLKFVYCLTYKAYFQEKNVQKILHHHSNHCY